MREIWGFQQDEGFRFSYRWGLIWDFQRDKSLGVVFGIWYLGSGGGSRRGLGIFICLGVWEWIWGFHLNGSSGTDFGFLSRWRLLWGFHLSKV